MVRPVQYTNAETSYTYTETSYTYTETSFIGGADGVRSGEAGGAAVGADALQPSLAGSNICTRKPHIRLVHGHRRSNIRTPKPHI